MKKAPNSKKQILLIESTGSHLEWIYTQNLFLNNSDYELHVACDNQFRTRLKYMSNDRLHMFNFIKVNLREYIKEIFKIRKLFKKYNYDLIVFNTAHNNFVRDVLIVLPNKTKKIGLLHRGQNLVNSATQRFITKRINGYITLADYQAKHVKLLTSKSLQTIYNTQFMYQIKQPEKINNQFFNVVIPGAVERYRRDYYSLIQFIENTDLPDDIRFIFLGKLNTHSDEHKDIFKQIEESPKNKYILYFTDYVNDDVFDKYIQSADILLPLIHPSMDNFDNYLKYQISGTFNLAYAYYKPMLIHEKFEEYPEFRISSIFYRTESLMDKLLEVYKNTEILKELENNIKTNQNLTFNCQREKYLYFINGILNKKKN